MTTPIFFAPTKKATKFLKANHIDLDKKVVDWFYELDDDRIVVQRYVAPDEYYDMLADHDGYALTYLEVRPVIENKHLPKMEVNEDRTDEDNASLFYGQLAMLAVAESYTKLGAAIDEVETSDTDEDGEQPENETEDIDLFGDSEADATNFTWITADGLSEAFELGSQARAGEFFVGQGIVQMIGQNNSTVMVFSSQEAEENPESRIAYNFTGYELREGDLVTLLQLVNKELVALKLEPTLRRVRDREAMAQAHFEAELADFEKMVNQHDEEAATASLADEVGSIKAMVKELVEIANQDTIAHVTVNGVTASKIVERKESSTHE